MKNKQNNNNSSGFCTKRKWYLSFRQNSFIIIVLIGLPFYSFKIPLSEVNISKKGGKITLHKTHHHTNASLLQPLELNEAKYFRAGDFSTKKIQQQNTSIQGALNFEDRSNSPPAILSMY